MNNDLPKGWATVSGANLFSFVTSGSRGWAKYYSDKGSLFLRISNLNHNSISLELSDKRFVSPPRSAEGTRTRVQIDDLLISITTDVGMVAWMDRDLGEAYINQHIAVARPLPGFSVPYVAWYITSSKGGQAQLRALQRGATKVGLGLDDIRSLKVPIAPLAEQHRIGAKLEAVLSKVDACQQRLEKIPAMLKRFRHSV